MTWVHQAKRKRQSISITHLTFRAGWGHELEGIELEENLKTMFNLHNRHGSEHERDGNFKAFVKYIKVGSLRRRPRLSAQTNTCAALTLAAILASTIGLSRCTRLRLACAHV